MTSPLTILHSPFPSSDVSAVWRVVLLDYLRTKHHKVTSRDCRVAHSQKYLVRRTRHQRELFNIQREYEVATGGTP